MMNRTPIHPGTILKDEPDEIGISPAELARQLKVPENRMSEVIRGHRGITADMALRARPLVRYICRFLDESTEKP